MRENNQKERMGMREVQGIEHKAKFHSYGIVTLWWKQLIRLQFIVFKILGIFYTQVQAKV